MSYDIGFIRETVAGYESDLIALRHDIHAHPELGFKETRTSDLVARLLETWGIAVHRGLGGTGVVGTLTGTRGEGRRIGLRADMDALPIAEAGPCAWRSTVPGAMHACGHDGHTAMLLGAARFLAAHRDFAGTVRFIFQPAEEGLGGARVMIEDGLFEKFPVDAVYGMHNMPGFAAGHLVTRPGAFMASSDTWTVTFRGTGGHGGAGAHLATDCTIPLGQFIGAVQTIVGRNVRALDPAVLSIGHVLAGSPGAPNVIPGEAVVRGTARCFSPEVRDLLERRLGEVASGLAAASGCTAELDYLRRYPPLVNHAAESEIAARAARRLFGEARVDTTIEPVTGSEDFSFMLQARPGAFVFLGNGVASEGHPHNVHTPLYDFNDDVLTLGAGYWCVLAFEEMGEAA